MRSTVILSVALGIATMSAEAVAGCTAGTQVTTGLFALVNNKLVCGRPVIPGYPGASSDRWQEEHLAGASPVLPGPLWDFKRGPGHAVDPRKQVGTWQVKVAGTVATISHNYGGVGFVWSVHDNGDSTYSFCTAPGGVEHVRAYIVAINPTVGCNGVYPP